MSFDAKKPSKPCRMAFVSLKVSIGRTRSM
jgi:hypothetical protein